MTTTSKAAHGTSGSSASSSGSTRLRPEGWMTRADMATVMRRSEDAVRRAVKNNHFQTREDDAGRVLVHVEDFLRLGLIRPEDLTMGATPAESAEALRTREIVTALKARVAELTGRRAQAALVRDTLREQPAVKDKQIAQQVGHLTQLTHLLGRFGHSSQSGQHGQVGGAA